MLIIVLNMSKVDFVYKDILDSWLAIGKLKIHEYMQQEVQEGGDTDTWP